MTISRRVDPDLKSLEMLLALVRAIEANDGRLNRTARTQVFATMRKGAAFARDGVRHADTTAEIINVAWALADEHALLDELASMNSANDFSPAMAERVLEAMQRFALA